MSKEEAWKILKIPRHFWKEQWLADAKTFACPLCGQVVYAPSPTNDTIWAAVCPSCGWKSVTRRCPSCGKIFSHDGWPLAGKPTEMACSESCSKHLTNDD